MCKAGQDSDGLPQLSDAEKAELDAMSMEQLLDGFKAAGRVFSKGTSCYRGVSLDKSTGKWYARLRVDRHQKQLGSFTSEEEAAQAYDRAALAKHGKYVWNSLVLPSAVQDCCQVARRISFVKPDGLLLWVKGCDDKFSCGAVLR